MPEESQACLAIRERWRRHTRGRIADKRARRRGTSARRTGCRERHPRPRLLYSNSTDNPDRIACLIRMESWSCGSRKDRTIRWVPTGRRSCRSSKPGADRKKCSIAVRMGLKLTALPPRSQSPRPIVAASSPETSPAPGTRLPAPAAFLPGPVPDPTTWEGWNRLRDDMSASPGYGIITLNGGSGREVRLDVGHGASDRAKHAIPAFLLDRSTASEPGPKCRSARARIRSPAGPCRSRTSPWPEPARARLPRRRGPSHAPHLP